MGVMQPEFTSMLKVIVLLHVPEQITHSISAFWQLIQIFKHTATSATAATYGTCVDDKAKLARDFHHYDEKTVTRHTKLRPVSMGVHGMNEGVSM
jgi:hypothetical protein